VKHSGWPGQGMLLSLVSAYAAASIVAQQGILEKSGATQVFTIASPISMPAAVNLQALQDDIPS
jgi:hypothetical protein